MPRRRRSLSMIDGLPVAAAAIFALLPAAAQAQSSASSLDLLQQPSLYGSPAAPPGFRRQGNVASADFQAPPAGTFTAPSRIGATPVYGTPPGFGAGKTGYDSTNTGGSAQQAQTSAQNAPGQAPPDTTFTAVSTATPPASRKPKRKRRPTPPAPEVYPASAASRAGAVLPPLPEPLPVSNPPAQVYPAAAAKRPGATLPVPGADAFAASAATPPPGSPPPNTLPLGTGHHALPLAEGDPYAPLGLRAGSFLVYPALELSTAYDTNPSAAPGGRPSTYFVVAPELQVRSDWSRHSLTADISGAYTDYANDNFAPSLNRPYLNGTIDGRIDVERNTQVLLENRFLVATDNPGSPNLAADLAKLPIYTTVGGTLGVAQEFNRLQVTLKGTFDRSSYQSSVLTNGETSSNSDRDFNQYGGILRVGYELGPGLQPFVEVQEDERIHDQQFDRDGLQRDSTGTSVKAGGTIDLLGSFTGELAVGYLERTYKDPTLPRIDGVIADGSLTWQATPLTTARLTAASSVSESILPGTSGAFSRDFNVQVDHAFLRWLIGSLQAGYGWDDYVGLDRLDDRYFASAGFTYKLSRELQLKATLRQDWLKSNEAGVSYDGTSVLLGLRLQR